jgi:hypothetical protein
VPPGATACAGGAIETSIDGTWTSAPLEGDTRFLEFRAVASGAAGFVAVGHQFGSEAGGIAEAVSFTSSDGRAWRRAPEQASLHGRTLTDVVARPGGGWLAVGAEAGPTVFQGINTWTSGDGLIWTLVDAMPQVGTVHGVTTVDGGFISWGTDCLDVCGPPERAAIWRSKDGSTWVRLPSQPSLAHGQVYDIIATPTGALAVGATFDVQAEATGVVWLSVDGVTWTKIALPGGARHQSFEVTSIGARYVTVGERLGDAGVVWGTWTSADSTTWIRLPDGDVRAAAFDIVASDGDVVGMAVGEPTFGESAVLRLRLD